MERLSLEHPILATFTYGEALRDKLLEIIVLLYCFLLPLLFYAINVDPIVRDAKTPKKVTIILTIKIANAKPSEIRNFVCNQIKDRFPIGAIATAKAILNGLVTCEPM